MILKANEDKRRKSLVLGQFGKNDVSNKNWFVLKQSQKRSGIHTLLNRNTLFYALILFLSVTTNIILGVEKPKFNSASLPN